MTLQQIIYIIEIARCCSINQAAQNLYTHQSNISNSLKQLEKELNIKIFHRTTKGVEITDDGKEFLSYAQSLLNQKNFIENVFAEKGRTRPLYFTVSSMRSHYMSRPFLYNYKEILDKSIYFRFKKTSLYQTIDDVANGDSDLGIIFMSRVSEKIVSKQIAAKKLKIVEIGKSRLHVVVRKGHPLLQTGKLDNLSDYPYIVIEESPGFNKIFEEETGLISPLFKKIPKHIISTNDSMVGMNIIAKTDAFYISSSQWRNSEYFDFESIPFEDNEDSVKICYLTRMDKLLPPYAIRYIQSVKTACDLQG